jgi:hypothetical protein
MWPKASRSRLLSFCAATVSFMSQAFAIEPPALKDQGSFFINGEVVRSENPGGDAPAGRVIVNQMYVEYAVPKKQKAGALPMILVHGSGHTGKTYDTTPDGREGWKQHFLRKGYTVYVIDHAGRARSGWNPEAINQAQTKNDASLIPKGGIIQFTYERAWGVFRFGPKPDEWWPDSKFPQKYLDQYIGQDGGYDTSGEVKKMCPSVERCRSAAALLNRRTGIGVTIATSSDSQRNDANFTSGTLEAHEYSHTIQNKQFVGRMPNNRQAPRWLVEGGAEFIQVASVYHESFAKYSSNRSAVTSGLFLTKTFNKAWLNDFLNPPSLGIDWENWNKYEGWRVYDVGFMVSEILVSIGGPNSIMEIFKLMGDGLTFQESFAKVFGISWDAGIETITKVLAKEIGN